MSKHHYAVPGFKASVVVSGLKKEKIPDLALIFSDKIVSAAGVFTTNRVKAAPVLVSMEHIKDGKVRAIIANSGNANACTGNKGMHHARQTAALVAEGLGIKPDEVIVASTGVIGAQLDMDLLRKAIPDLVNALSPEGLGHAAEAIMTTDSFPKISMSQSEAGGIPYHILGIAKGAGMIMPNMATMLCFILTDLGINDGDLKRALLRSVEDSFNRITVDGDTSTNDMVIVMANGLAGNRKLKKTDYEEFQRSLTHVMTDLATLIVKDGEGATKVVHIYVKGAATQADSTQAARTVANSNLVKTAFYGQDPNWGRIMAALGRSGVSMREEELDLWIDDVRIVEKGLGIGLDAEKMAAEKMAKSEFSLIIDLKQGDHEDHILTCDLTHEYVSINADYRT